MQPLCSLYSASICSLYAATIQPLLRPYAASVHPLFSLYAASICCCCPLLLPALFLPSISLSLSLSRSRSLSIPASLSLSLSFCLSPSLSLSFALPACTYGILEDLRLDIPVPVLQVLRSFNAAATFNYGNEGFIRCAVCVLKYLTLGTKPWFRGKKSDTSASLPGKAAKHQAYFRNQASWRFCSRRFCGSVPVSGKRRVETQTGSENECTLDILKTSCYTYGVYYLDNLKFATIPSSCTVYKAKPLFYRSN